MKKLLTLAIVLLLTSANLFASGGKYKINDQQVDDMFATSTEITVENLNLMLSGSIGLPSEQLAEKNPWIAWILCATYFGHRIYLGTKTGTIILYVCTGGGCGIITSVDAILLLIGAINEDISKYVDNEKFIMW